MHHCASTSRRPLYSAFMPFGAGKRDFTCSELGKTLPAQFSQVQGTFAATPTI